MLPPVAGCAAGWLPKTVENESVKIDNPKTQLTTSCSWLIGLLLLLVIILPKNRASAKQSTTRWLLSLVLLAKQTPSWLRRSGLPENTRLGRVAVIIGVTKRPESACVLLRLGLAKDATCGRLLLLRIVPEGTSTTKRASATKATGSTSCKKISLCMKITKKVELLLPSEPNAPAGLDWLLF